MLLKDKVVIITGATSGIGKALAFEAASKGARLAIAARNTQHLDDTVKQIQNRYKTEIISVPCDVSREEDCKKLIQTTVNAYKGIDALINNAGISMRALFNDCDLKVIEQVMNINFWGTVYCTKYALPYLLQSKGSVTGVSSIAGYKGLPGRTGYSASKFAMRGFLESLRIENLEKGLHVLIACPGFTTSNIRNTALGKDGRQQNESPRDEGAMMSAEEVATHLIKAIENRKRTIVLTRQGKLTVLMNKFFPGFMDRQVFKVMRKEPGSPF